MAVGCGRGAAADGNHSKTLLWPCLAILGSVSKNVVGLWKLLQLVQTCNSGTGLALSFLEYRFALLVLECYLEAYIAHHSCAIPVATQARASQAGAGAG